MFETFIFSALPPIDKPIMEPNTNYSAKFVGYGYYDDSLTASEALREADFTIFEGSYCEPLFSHTQIKRHLLNTSILMCAGTDVRHNLSFTLGGIPYTPVMFLYALRKKLPPTF